MLFPFVGDTVEPVLKDHPICQYTASQYRFFLVISSIALKFCMVLFVVKEMESDTGR